MQVLLGLFIFCGVYAHAAVLDSNLLMAKAMLGILNAAQVPAAEPTPASMSQDPGDIFSQSVLHAHALRWLHGHAGVLPVARDRPHLAEPKLTVAVPPGAAAVLLRAPSLQASAPVLAGGWALLELTAQPEGGARARAGQADFQQLLVGVDLFGQCQPGIQRVDDVAACDAWHACAEFVRAARGRVHWNHTWAWRAQALQALQRSSASLNEDTAAALTVLIPAVVVTQLKACPLGDELCAQMPSDARLDDWRTAVQGMDEHTHSQGWNMILHASDALPSAVQGWVAQVLRRMQAAEQQLRTAELAAPTAVNSAASALEDLRQCETLSSLPSAMSCWVAWYLACEDQLSSAPLPSQLALLHRARAGLMQVLLRPSMVQSLTQPLGRSQRHTALQYLSSAWGWISAGAPLTASSAGCITEPSPEVLLLASHMRDRCAVSVLQPQHKLPSLACANGEDCSPAVLAAVQAMYDGPAPQPCDGPAACAAGTQHVLLQWGKAVGTALDKVRLQFLASPGAAIAASTNLQLRTRLHLAVYGGLADSQAIRGLQVLLHRLGDTFQWQWRPAMQSAQAPVSMIMQRLIQHDHAHLNCTIRAPQSALWCMPAPAHVAAVHASALRQSFQDVVTAAPYVEHVGLGSAQALLPGLRTDFPPALSLLLLHELHACATLQLANAGYNTSSSACSPSSTSWWCMLTRSIARVRAAARAEAPSLAQQAWQSLAARHRTVTAAAARAWTAGGPACTPGLLHGESLVVSPSPAVQWAVYQLSTHTMPALNDPHLVFLSSYIAPRWDPLVKSQLRVLHSLAPGQGLALQVGAHPNFHTQLTKPAGKPAQLAMIGAQWYPAHAVHRNMHHWVRALLQGAGLPATLVVLESSSADRAMFDQRGFQHMVALNRTAPNDVIAQSLRDLQTMSPDVLLFPQVGMHPLDMLLSSTRTAPIQVATYGHSASSESRAAPHDSIDVFIGGWDAEVGAELSRLHAVATAMLRCAGNAQPTLAQLLQTIEAVETEEHHAYAAMDKHWAGPGKIPPHYTVQRAHIPCQAEAMPPQLLHTAEQPASPDWTFSQIAFSALASLLGTLQPACPAAAAQRLPGGSLPTAAPIIVHGQQVYNVPCALQKLQQIHVEQAAAGPCARAEVCALAMLALKHTLAASARYSEQLLLLPGPGVAFAGLDHIPRPGQQPATPDHIRVLLTGTSVKLWGPHLRATGDVLRFAAAQLPSTTTLQLVLVPAMHHSNQGELPALVQALEHELQLADVPRVSVHLSPSLPFTEFQAHMATGDVALDPWPYTGCNSIHDAVHAGVPVVTLQGRHWRSRAGPTLLRRLGLSELVALSQAEWQHKAVRLITDSTYRASVRQHLLRHPLSPEHRGAGEAAAVAARSAGAWLAQAAAHRRADMLSEARMEQDSLAPQALTCEAEACLPLASLPCESLLTRTGAASHPLATWLRATLLTCPSN